MANKIQNTINSSNITDISRKKLKSTFVQRIDIEELNDRIDKITKNVNDVHALVLTDIDELNTLKDELVSKITKIKLDIINMDLETLNSIDQEHITNKKNEIISMLDAAKIHLLNEDIYNKILEDLRSEYKNVTPTEIVTLIFYRINAYLFSLKEAARYKLLNTSNIIKKISCNLYSTIILLKNNELWTCGNNTYGQLGFGDTTDRNIFTLVTKPSNMTSNIKDISCGGYHSSLLLENNELWTCGNNTYGQLGLGDKINRSTFTQVTKPATMTSPIKYITSGVYYTVLLCEDSSLWVVGNNNYGQLGFGDTTDRKVFTKVTRPSTMTSNVKDIYSETNHTVLLTNDNEIWSCGYNSNGQLGFGDTTDRNIFTKVTKPSTMTSNIKELVCGYSHTVLLTNDNEIWSCGYNSNGQLGLGDNTNRNIFTLVNLDELDINYFPLVSQDLNDSEKGKYFYRMLPDVKSLAVTYPILSSNSHNIDNSFLTHSSYGKFTKLFSRTNDFFAINDDGRLLGMGKTAIENSDSSNALFPMLPENFHIAYSSDIIYDNPKVVKEEKIFNTDLWVVGNNTYGQLGLGSIINAYNYTLLPRMESNFKSISNGRTHTLLLLEDNTLWVTGENQYGQLGLGDTTNRSVFTKVTKPVDMTSPIKEIDSGYYYNIILCEDNSLWVVGNNTYGQLGLGDTTQRNIFTRITKPKDMISDVKKVYCSIYHCFLLLKDNSLWACGENEKGQLGLGDYNDRSTFTKVTKPVDMTSSIKEISCTFDQTLLLLENNELWVTGENGSGQLGLGDTIDRKVFTKVTRPSTMTSPIKKIRDGNAYVILLCEDNSLWVIGNNGFGELGLGSVSSDVYSFTKVTKPSGMESNIVEIITGNHFNILLLEDNTLWVTGENASGQLGLGNIVNRASYTLVTKPYYMVNTSVNNIRKIFAKFNHVILLLDKSVILEKKIINKNIMDKVKNFFTPSYLYKSYDKRYTNSSFALTESGKLYEYKRKEEDRFKFASNYGIKEVAFTNSHIFIITGNGELYVAGASSYQYLNSIFSPSVSYDPKIFYKVQIPKSFLEQGIKEIDHGSMSDNIMILTERDSLICGGRNFNKRFGVVNYTGDSYAWLYCDYSQEARDIGVRWLRSTNYTTYLILNNDDIWTCGGGSYGETALSTTSSIIVEVYTKITTKPAEMIGKKILQFECGISHTLILLEDNSLWAFGYNIYGQCGLGNNTESIYVFTKITNRPTYSPIKNIFASLNWSIIQLENDEIWGCGRNNAGQLGLGDTTNRNIFTRVSSFDIFLGETIQVECGGYNLYVLKKKDNIYRLYGSGNNSYGQMLSGGTISDSYFATAVETQYFSRVIDNLNITSIKIIAHYNAFRIGVLINGDSLYVAGGNIDTVGSLGVNSSGNTQYLQSVSETNNLFFSREYDTYTKNYAPIASIERKYKNTTTIKNPTRLIDSPSLASIVLNKYNQIYWTGRSTYGEIGENRTISYFVKSSFTKHIDYGCRIKDVISFHHGNIIQIEEDENLNPGTVTGVNDLWVSSYNSSGEAGVGNTTYVSSYTNLRTTNPSLPKYIRKIIPMQVSVHILGKDNSLWSVGNNTEGELGLGDITNRNIYTKNTTTQYKRIQDRIVDIFHNLYSLFIITEDNEIWATGNNTVGQLGLGDTTDRNIFTKVIKPSTMTSPIKEMTGGMNHTFALLENGQLWACGQNSNGQLGLGDTTNRTTFTQVTTSEKIKKIACIEFSSMYLTDGNNLYSAGQNNFGQLGLGDNTNRNIFTLISLNNIYYNTNMVIKQLSTTHYSFRILLEDDTILGVGNNDNGTLGINTTETINATFQNTNKYYSISEQHNPGSFDAFTRNKMIDSPIIDIVSSYYLTYMLTKDDDIYVFGRNVAGGGNYGSQNENELLPIPLKMDKPVRMRNSKIKQLCVHEFHTPLTVLMENDDIWYLGRMKFLAGQEYEDTHSSDHCVSRFTLVKKPINMQGKIKKIAVSTHILMVLMEDGSVWGATNAGSGYHLGYQTLDIANSKTLKQLDLTGIDGKIRDIAICNEYWPSTMLVTDKNMLYASGQCTYFTGSAITNYVYIPLFSNYPLYIASITSASVGGDTVSTYDSEIFLIMSSTYEFKDFAYIVLIGPNTSSKTGHDLGPLGTVLQTSSSGNKSFRQLGFSNNNVCQISSSGRHIGVVFSNGQLKLRGLNDKGQLGIGTLANDVTTMADVNNLTALFNYTNSYSPVKKVACGSKGSSVLLENGEVYVSGDYLRTDSSAITKFTILDNDSWFNGSEVVAARDNFLSYNKNSTPEFFWDKVEETPFDAKYIKQMIISSKIPNSIYRESLKIVVTEQHKIYIKGELDINYYFPNFTLIFDKFSNGEEIIEIMFIEKPQTIRFTTHNINDDSWHLYSILPTSEIVDISPNTFSLSNNTNSIKLFKIYIDYTFTFSDMTNLDMDQLGHFIILVLIRNKNSSYIAYVTWESYKFIIMSSLYNSLYGSTIGAEYITDLFDHINRKEITITDISTIYNMPVVITSRNKIITIYRFKDYFKNIRFYYDLEVSLNIIILSTLKEANYNDYSSTYFDYATITPPYEDEIGNVYIPSILAIQKNTNTIFTFNHLSSFGGISYNSTPMYDSAIDNGETINPGTEFYALIYDRTRYFNNIPSKLLNNTIVKIEFVYNKNGSAQAVFLLDNDEVFYTNESTFSLTYNEINGVKINNVASTITDRYQKLYEDDFTRTSKLLSSLFHAKDNNGNNIYKFKYFVGGKRETYTTYKDGMMLSQNNTYIKNSEWIATVVNDKNDNTQYLFYLGPSLYGLTEGYDLNTTVDYSNVNYRLKDNLDNSFRKTVELIDIASINGNIIDIQKTDNMIFILTSTGKLYFSGTISYTMSGTLTTRKKGLSLYTPYTNSVNTYFVYSVIDLNKTISTLDTRFIEKIWVIEQAESIDQSSLITAGHNILNKILYILHRPLSDPVTTTTHVFGVLSYNLNNTPKYTLDYYNIADNVNSLSTTTFDNIDIELSTHIQGAYLSTIIFDSKNNGYYKIGYNEMDMYSLDTVAIQLYSFGPHSYYPIVNQNTLIYKENNFIKNFNILSTKWNYLDGSAGEGEIKIYYNKHLSNKATTITLRQIKILLDMDPDNTTEKYLYYSNSGIFGISKDNKEFSFYLIGENNILDDYNRGITTSNSANNNLIAFKIDNIWDTCFNNREIPLGYPRIKIFISYPLIYGETQAEFAFKEYTILLINDIGELYVAYATGYHGIVYTYDEKLPTWANPPRFPMNFEVYRNLFNSKDNDYLSEGDKRLFFVKVHSPFQGEFYMIEEPYIFLKDSSFVEKPFDNFIPPKVNDYDHLIPAIIGKDNIYILPDYHDLIDIKTDNIICSFNAQSMKLATLYDILGKSMNISLNPLDKACLDDILFFALKLKIIDDDYAASYTIMTDITGWDNIDNENPTKSLKQTVQIYADYSSNISPHKFELSFYRRRKNYTDTYISSYNKEKHSTEMCMCIKALNSFDRWKEINLSNITSDELVNRNGFTMISQTQLLIGETPNFIPDLDSSVLYISNGKSIFTDEWELIDSVTITKENVFGKITNVEKKEDTILVSTIKDSAVEHGVLSIINIDITPDNLNEYLDETLIEPIDDSTLATTQTTKLWWIIVNEILTKNIGIPSNRFINFDGFILLANIQYEISSIFITNKSFIVLFHKDQKYNKWDHNDSSSNIIPEDLLTYYNENLHGLEFKLTDEESAVTNASANFVRLSGNIYIEKTDLTVENITQYIEK
jgi:alpha-tubulin suppressor-like RCC1 family protein